METPQPPTQIHLNDCRKCGSYAVLHQQRALPMPGQRDEFVAVCSTCVKRGSWKESEFEAAADWNQKNRPRS